MAGLKDWSTSAASNTSASPNGFPENMAPSGVNDAAREVMAQVRTWFEDAQWTNLGHVPTRTGASAFTVPSAGTLTTVYHINRRLKLLDGSNTWYATITDQTYAGGASVAVTIQMDSGALTSSLSSVYTSILTAVNTAIPAVTPAGAVMDFAGSTAPLGWLECDGSAVSRTTYSALFAAISTTWGPGDGVATFNLPSSSGRARIGRGTGTDVETVTGVLAAGNAIAVASNSDKWITGRAVVISGITGFGGGVTNTTVYVVRASSTSVKFASTLANAQNGTVLTLTGTGSLVMTATLTARTIGNKGGEETHAMSSSELLAHTHASSEAGGAAGAPGGATTFLMFSDFTGSSGGNAAMNNMQPYGVYMTIIKT